MIGLVEFEKGADGVIGFTSKGHEAWIWQGIDNEDNQFLADLMVQAGMRIPAAAYVVRMLANSAWQFKMAGIMGPRFLQTWHHYAMYGFGFAMMAGGPQA